MVNYNNGKIYKIVCNETGEVYYGCTTQKLNKRKECHVGKAKDKIYSSYIIINRGNWTMSLIENYACSSKEELQARENEYILNNPCVNKIRSYNTPEERELKKQKDKELQAKWREENREYLLQQKRNYHHANKEQIAEKNKEYREKNKEQIAEKKKIEYEKDKQNGKCDIINCECGGTYSFKNKPRHLKTKKHQDYLTNKN
jgi:hypothetical protein